jgi:hypothetical protein
MSHEHRWPYHTPNSNSFSECECGAQVASIHKAGAAYTHFYTGDLVKFKGKPPGEPEQLITGTIKKFTTTWVGTNKHGSSRRKVVLAMVDSVNGKGVFPARLGKFEHVSAVDALGAIVEPE